MDNNTDTKEILLQLAKISLTKRPTDVHLYLQRLVARKSTDSELADSLIEVLRERPVGMSSTRTITSKPIPVDADSRAHLLRVDEKPHLPRKAVFTETVQRDLKQLSTERKNVESLMKAGLESTRTVLFTGDSGVGKTLAAKWLARELNYPLLTLDFAAVISSSLERTGSNLRQVFDYAKSVNCVLLIDELDAIAKRRDDQSEIGELKRLPTVLLQQLDEWPSSGLLIGVTNQPELLDLAVWRRFEKHIEFPLPDKNLIKIFVEELLGEIAPEARDWSGVLSIAMKKQSFHDIEQQLKFAVRSSILSGESLKEFLPNLLRSEYSSKRDRIELATSLVKSNLISQRQAQSITGIARETIRKYRDADNFAKSTETNDR